MSRSTESMSEGEEKLGNSKNNLENEIPKVTPTTESKGARPKTSSTSIKPEKQTVEKKQLKVLTINAFGPNKGKGSTETRKHTIQIVIKRHEPDLVLFQELKWTKKVEKWPSDLLPIKYKFVGKSEEANIMYNINTLSATDIQRDPHDSFDFNSRMCSSMFNINGVANTEFICISYHGRHNEKTDTDKLDEFENLKKFLTQLYEKHSLPILIGGDFNVNIKLICKNVENPFKLYDYASSARRKKNGVIDYFIASPNIDLFEIKPVDLKNYSKARIQENMKLIWELGLLRKRTISSSSVQLGRTSKVNVQPFSYLVEIDFESTCWKDGKFRTQEIIEFPAVLLNTETGQIEGEFHHYVQPQEDPILSEFCTELTGINQAQVDEGIPLPICLRKFSHWLDKLQNEKDLRFNSSDPHKNKGTFVTWSDWDLGVCLLYECKRKQILKPIQLNSWIDLRATYRKFYGRKPNGLNGALEDLGITFQGREHSGLDDARNTAKLAWRMMCDGCVMKITKTIKPQNSPNGETIKLPTSNLSQKNQFDHRESKVFGQPDIPYLPEYVTDTEHVDNKKQKCHQKHLNVKVVKDGRTSHNVEYDALHHGTDAKGITRDENYHCEKRSPVLPDECGMSVSSVVEDSSKDKTVEISQTQIKSGSKRSIELTPRSGKQRSKIPKIIPGKAFTSSEIYRDPESPKHLVENPKMTRNSSELRVLDMNVVNSNSDRMESNIKDCIDVIKGANTSDTSSTPKKFHSDIINQLVKSQGRFKSPNPKCKENSVLSKTYLTKTILNPPTSKETVNNQPFCGTTTAGDRTAFKTPNTSCIPGKSIGHNGNSSYKLSPNISSISSRLTSQFKTPTLVQPSNINQCRTLFDTHKIPGNLSFKTVSPSGSETPNTSRLNASLSMKSTPPLCKCGRRAKRRMVQSPGPNMGRFFFTCSTKQDGDDTRKKGCNFFKWENSMDSTHSGKSFSHNNSRNFTINGSSINQYSGMTNRKSLGVRSSVRV